MCFSHFGHLHPLVQIVLPLAQVPMDQRKPSTIMCSGTSRSSVETSEAMDLQHPPL